MTERSRSPISNILLLNAASLAKNTEVHHLLSLRDMAVMLKRGFDRDRIHSRSGVFIPWNSGMDAAIPVVPGC